MIEEVEEFSDMFDHIDELDVDDKVISSRIAIINKAIFDTSKKLRDNISELMTEKELMASDTFKLCMIATLILEKSMNDETGEFSRLLYFMFEKSKNVMNLLNQYELNIINDESEGYKFELIIIETEFTEDV